MTSRFNHDRSVRLEWWAVVAALVLLVGTIATREWLWRADQMLYDAALAVWWRPAPQDIVIVDIDDRSLAQVGRWPWRRAVHATLIDRLTEDGAKAVGLDLLLSDRDATDAASDTSLADAMRRSGRVVLPLALAPTDRPEVDDQLPLPEFAKGAAQLGFAHVVIDADGIVRRLRLREIRNGDELASFALRVLAVAAAAHAGDAAPGEPGARALGIDVLSLPFAGPPGHFRHVSYVDVLRGNVPAGFFHDKIVLVGATATGLVGRYATPVSGLTQTMSGVEIQANAIDALRRLILIRTISPATVAAVAVAALALLLFLLRQASARAGLVLTLASFLITLVLAVVLLRFAQLWYAPAAALVGCALAYPVWSWRRLEAAQNFLDVELLELQKEPILLGQTPSSPLPAADRLQRRLDAVRIANASRRRARRFLSDAVDSLPVGMIVADAQRRVVLANRRAIVLLRRDGLPIIGEDLGQVVAAARGDIKESEARGLPAEGETPAQFEMTSSDGRPLLVGIAHSATEEGDLAGYIVSMADVTDLRSAQHTRDEMLRFLSHDLRAPLASVISMIDVMQEPDVDASGLFTLDRVQELARRALDLADDFMRLARAEALNPKLLRAVDLAVLVAQAADEVLALANVKKVRLDAATDAKPGSAFVLGDADLLRRALINLLTNAVRHSPEGEAVTLSLTGDSQWWHIAVADRGQGISADQISELFARYVRFNTPGARGSEGFGLGLVIVKAVAEKHGGNVAVESAPGQGARFIVTLPRKEPASKPSTAKS